jgi:hypothetical protein
MSTQEMKALLTRVLESPDQNGTLNEILRQAGALDILPAWRARQPDTTLTIESLEELFLEALARRGRDYPDRRREQGPSLTTDTVRRKRVRSDIDLNRSPDRSERISEWFFGDKAYSLIGVPILLGERALGLLQVFRRRDAIDDVLFFKNDEIQAVAELGKMIEAAIAAEVECLPIPVPPETVAEDDDLVQTLQVAVGLAQGEESHEWEEIGILLRKSGVWAIDRLIANCGEDAAAIRENATILLKDLKDREHVAKRLFPDWYQRRQPEETGPQGEVPPPKERAATESRKGIFVSYSHNDPKQWIERLTVHLRPLERRLGLKIWFDGRIDTGSRWSPEIHRAIEGAAFAILLVSANFLASEYIVDTEIPMLLAAEERGLKIFPLHLSASDYDGSELRDLQAFNSMSSPLNTMSEGDIEKTLAALAKEIEKRV